MTISNPNLSSSSPDSSLRIVGYDNLEPIPEHGGLVRFRLQLNRPANAYEVHTGRILYGEDGPGLVDGVDYVDMVAATVALKNFMDEVQMRILSIALEAGTLADRGIQDVENAKRVLDEIDFGG